ncbi:hypothetical protein GCM10023115_32560 [Pontixanthobacter gangjinensis]|uniref:Uncharacterized protein n=1 Tax=Christiangramia aestuarii TaxID=1028746 RepID=A0A7K1LS88_9FLAO|nr:hypothetical protein [Christiangramia aestuarii]MUP43674.1 hypothetical protein [Christiangramia aestuarii]
MDKEYNRVLFGIDSKKLNFKTNAGKLTEVMFKIHFPDKFELLSAKFVNKERIEIKFTGTDGSTVEENLSNSTREISDQISVDLSEVTEIPKAISIEFILAQVEGPAQEGFVPDTVGGGILVGTGG